MDLRSKVERALTEALGEAFIRLEDDDGISGYVVSPRFAGMSTLDRQTLIDRALRTASEPLNRNEQRQVLMIGGLTPTEFNATGSGIRVHRIREMPDGSISILLRGKSTDAEYVRGALKNLKGVATTIPEESPGAAGILISFQAKGTPANPLTRDRVIQVLEDDPYISLMLGNDL